MLQALRSTRPGGLVGTVGAPHGVEVPIEDLFWPNLGLRGGPAPVRRYLPDLLDRSGTGRSSRALSSTCELPLDQVADAYRAMDERRAIKALLWP